MRHAVEVCLGLIGSRSRPCPCTAGLTKKNYQMVTRWRRVGPLPFALPTGTASAWNPEAVLSFAECRSGARRAKLRREPKTEAPLAPADAAVHSCLQQRIASGRVYRVAFPIICVRHDGPAVVFHVPECMARNRHSCQSANGAQAERLVG